MLYDKQIKRVRTPRVNSVVSLISSEARVSEENEKGYLVKSSLDSRFVANIGASLEEFAEDVRAILELTINNK